MNKERTLHAFWASFGWKAYDENSVPDDAVFPYITYEMQTDNIGHPVYLSASLWDRSTSWESVTDKANEIAADIGYSYKSYPVDGGFLWITRGSPFMQRGADDDDTVRRMLLNISVEFLTEY